MKNVTNSSVKTKQKVYDEGLREYMTNIFKYMSIALLITALVAFVTSRTSFLLHLIYGTPLYILVAIAPLIYVFYFTTKVWSMSPERARNNLWIYSGLMGLSLTSIFLSYSTLSLTRTFVITAATFAGMSLYGNVTKKDLTGLGSFLGMGIFGIIIASLVNLFLKSPVLEFGLSAIGVLIFVGLTAFDVQKLKETYSYVGINSDSREKVAIIGALSLYMDFINLFITLLRFFGERNNK